MATSEWLSRAACRDKDPDLFFSEAPRLTVARVRADAAALHVCSRCPVVGECRDAGDESEAGILNLYGIHGGETPTDRVRRRAGLRRMGAA